MMINENVNLSTALRKESIGGARPTYIVNITFRIILDYVTYFVIVLWLFLFLESNATYRQTLLVT